MARRKKGGRRAVAKTVYRKARGGGGALKPILDGFLAGAGGALAAKYIGTWGHPAVTLGVGFFRNNNVLKTEGARELGAMAVAQFTGGMGGANGGRLYN